MTVKKVTAISDFIGESTDAKPVSEVPAGSRFHELDTGSDYVFTGVSWRISTGATTTSTSGAP